MKTNRQSGVSGAVAIGFAALPLIVISWASYATAAGPFVLTGSANA